MPIFVKKELTLDLVRKVYGSLDEMAADWEAKAAANSRLPTARQGESIEGWVNKKGVPAGGKMDPLYFAFCGLLDVDPLAILDFTKQGYDDRFADLRKFIYVAHKVAGIRKRVLDGVTTLLNMYRPHEKWPSDELAMTFYGRQWHAVEFTNENRWKCSDYILLKSVFDKPVEWRPRAVHIAYRRLNSVDTMWRYYGTVLLVGGELHLYTEGGVHQSMLPVKSNEIRFRTYYGGRRVEWRVASLHSFQLLEEFPFNDSATIGFDW